MKKGILFIALFAASFGFMQSSFAAPSMSANSITNVLAISDYEGTYSGTMDNIIMRGKPYESRAATYKIEGGRLKCDFPQIGSMPGTITISLAVEVDEDTGGITAYNGDEAGTLSLPLGIKVKLYLDDLRDAKITDNGSSKQIEFTLDVSGTFLGANFPASVHFVGIK